MHFNVPPHYLPPGVYLTVECLKLLKPMARPGLSGIKCIDTAAATVAANSGLWTFYEQLKFYSSEKQVITFCAMEKKTIFISTLSSYLSIWYREIWGCGPCSFLLFTSFGTKHVWTTLRSAHVSVIWHFATSIWPSAFHCEIYGLVYAIHIHKNDNFDVSDKVLRTLLAF